MHPDRNSATMMIPLVEMPQPRGNAGAGSASPRSADPVFHDVLRAGGGADPTREGGDIVTDAPARQTAARQQAANGADLAAEMEDGHDAATPTARTSWPTTPHGAAQQDVASVPKTVAGGPATPDAPIMKRRQASASGQDPAPVVGTAMATPSDTSPASASSQSAGHRGDSPLPEIVPAGTGVIRAQIASNQGGPSAQAEMVGGRAMLTAPEASDPVETRARSRGQAGAFDAPGKMTQSRIPRLGYDTQGQGAMQALAGTRMAAAREADAAFLMAGQTDGMRDMADVSAPMRLRPQGQVMMADTGSPPALVGRQSGDIAARDHAAQDVTQRSIAQMVAQGKFQTDAQRGPSGVAAAQVLRAMPDVQMPVAPSLASLLSQGPTGSAGVAIPSDGLRMDLPDLGMVEAAAVTSLQSRAELGRSSARLPESYPASSPKVAVQSGGALPFPGSPAPAIPQSDPSMFSRTSDRIDPAGRNRTDRPDGGPLPAPGLAPALASLTQPHPAGLAAGIDARSLRVQILDGMRRPGQSAFEIQLAPAELGRLRITLRPGDNGMQLFFTADRPETLEMLRRHAVDLEHDLRVLGYDALDLGFAQSDDQPPDSAPSQSAAPNITSDAPGPAQEAGRQARSGVGRGHVDMRL